MFHLNFAAMCPSFSLHSFNSLIPLEIQLSRHSRHPPNKMPSKIHLINLQHNCYKQTPATGQTKLKINSYSHCCTGKGVIQLTELHGTVQVKFRFCLEAKHVKTVANDGTLPISALVNEGKRFIISTPRWEGEFQYAVALMWQVIMCSVEHVLTRWEAERRQTHLSHLQWSVESGSPNTHWPEAWRNLQAPSLPPQHKPTFVEK